jgi:hypothetical protein
MGGWLYTASHSIFPPRASAAVSPVCLPQRSASVEHSQYMKKLYEGAFLTSEDKQSPVTPSSTMKSAFTSQEAARISYENRSCRQLSRYFWIVGNPGKNPRYKSRSAQNRQLAQR